MPTYQPPPTYAEVIETTDQGKPRFSPIWLRWFLDLVQFISLNGSTAPGGLIQHNNTGGIQGGAPSDYYHLTLAQLKRTKSDKVLLWLSM